MERHTISRWAIRAEIFQHFLWSRDTDDESRDMFVSSWAVYGSFFSSFFSFSSAAAALFCFLWFSGAQLSLIRESLQPSDVFVLRSSNQNIPRERSEKFNERVIDLSYAYFTLERDNLSWKLNCCEQRKIQILEKVKLSTLEFSLTFARINDEQSSQIVCR